MKKENNKLYALTILIATPAWIAILIAKGRGTIGINWPTAILGAVWIPALTLAALLGLTGVLVLLHEATKRIHEWKRRRKVARTLWESMEGLALNNIGPIYGIRRQPGEKNRSYKRRILKAARTLDTVNVQNAPTPATGQKLDAIAKKARAQALPSRDRRAAPEPAPGGRSQKSGGRAKKWQSINQKPSRKRGPTACRYSAHTTRSWTSPSWCRTRRTRTSTRTTRSSYSAA